MAATAVIRGPLLALVGLAEGRIDGDTEAVVALRNALESAEIELAQDLLAPLGPLSRPLARLLEDAGDRASRLVWLGPDGVLAGRSKAGALTLLVGARPVRQPGDRDLEQRHRQQRMMAFAGSSAETLMPGDGAARIDYSGSMASRSRRTTVRLIPDTLPSRAALAACDLQ